ncbi:hypothetical protein MNBD_UNCLBAC01-358, partial [hydrothermal vent metagenome]
SLLGQIYVDQNKIAGVDIEDKDEKHKIYNQYLKAFENVFDVERKKTFQTSSPVLMSETKDMAEIRRIFLLPHLTQEEQKLFDTYFQNYVKEYGLSDKAAKALKPLFTTQIARELIYDSALKPVMLEVLPEKYLGPIQLEGVP